MLNDQRPFEYIDSSEALEAFCARARATKSPIAVDTEFARETTYFSKLCTIQIATQSELALIDALAPGIDLDLLKPLFLDQNIIKIFHAARQDLEIFYHMWDALPAPIADTQIIAMVNGFGDSVGYQSLVKSLMQVTLCKEHRISDWLQRPLTQAQIQYAMGDVIYLIDMHHKLMNQIKDRASWIEEELNILTQVDTYRIEPKNAWMRLKIPAPISPQAFSVIQALAFWREEEAVAQDKPRHHILKNPTLWEIVKSSNPETKAKNLLKQKYIRKSLEPSLLKCLEEREKAPIVPESLRTASNASASDALVLEILKTLFKLVCQHHGIAPKLLCSTDVLKQIVAGNRNDLNVLEGWRYEIFGAEALRLLEGKSSLKIIDGVVTVC